MNDLTVRKCFECGHHTIARLDGVRCAECGAATNYIGPATIVDRNRNLIAEIKIKAKDIEIVQTMTKVLYSLVDDECTPEWIKVKIKSVALNKLEKG